MTTAPGLDAAIVYAKLPAQDLERARRFYAERLGIEPFAESDGHLYYAVGDTRFMVFRSTGRPSGTHDQLGFVVTNLRDRVDELSRRGIVFDDNDLTVDHIADFGAVRAAWFNDSEGNLLNLIEGTSPLWARPT